MRATTVLIVDDNRRLAEVLRSLIDEEPDFDVRQVATTAAEAAQRLRVEQVDVVIVDDRLPDASGLAVVTRLRDAQPDIRVLLWSSTTADQNIDYAGVDGLLTKGETFQVLMGQLRRAVRAPRRRSRSVGRLG